MVVNALAPMLNVSLTLALSSVSVSQIASQRSSHVEKLVAVASAADHREAVAGVRPVIEEREHAKPFRADERFGTDDRDASPARALEALLFRQNLGASIRPDADQRVVLYKRMMVGDAVHGG